MDIWGKVTFTFGLSLLFTFFAGLIGQVLYFRLREKKEQSNSFGFLDSLIEEYKKSYASHSKSSNYSNETLKSSPQENAHASMDSSELNVYYEKCLELLEDTQEEKTRSQILKIMNFLKDLRHPSLGPNFKNWASLIGKKLGFGPLPRDIHILFLSHGTEIKRIFSRPGFPHNFFNFLENLWLLQLWHGEIVLNKSPQNVSAYIKSRYQISRQDQKLTYFAWILENAGMPLGQILKNIGSIEEQFQKIPIQKIHLIHCKLAYSADGILLLNQVPIKWESLQKEKNKEKFEHHQRQEKRPPGHFEKVETDYEVLGVSPSDSIHHIKKTYRKLVLTYHPDRLDQKNLSEFEIKMAQAKFVKIKQSYDRILSRKAKTA